MNIQAMNKKIIATREKEDEKLRRKFFGYEACVAPALYKKFGIKQKF
jgi:hypothetical protein